MAEETAEQRLLRLIEASQAEEKPDHASAQPSEVEEIRRAVSGTGGPMVSLPGFGGFRFGAGMSWPVWDVRAWGLPQINVALSVVVVLLLVLLIRQALVILPQSRRPLALATPPPTPIQAAGTKSAEGLLERILARAQQRNIFEPYEETVVEETVESTTTASSSQKIAEKVQDLKLVGISWLDTTDSVTAMIEDQKTLVTHFVREGETIKDVRVEKIYTDRIVVSYDGETMTLHL